MTSDLRFEIQPIACRPQRREVAYYCGRRNFFMGRWIKHAMSPGMIMRFFKPEQVRFERLVNPPAVIDGPHGYLKHHLLHCSFSKRFTEWFEKHNKYSQLEALELLKGSCRSVSSVFTSDAASRRRALKELSFQVPFRSFLKFLYLYVIKRGFLAWWSCFTTA